MNCQIYPIVQPGMQVQIFGRDRWVLTGTAPPFWRGGNELPGDANRSDYRAGRGGGWIFFCFDSLAEL